MKGKTLARKARASGWAVSTSFGGKYIRISQLHRTHGFTNPYVDRDNPFRAHNDGGFPCGYSTHIRIECDNSGEVTRVTKSTRETIRAGDLLSDLAGIAGGWIEEMRLGEADREPKQGEVSTDTASAVVAGRH